MGMNASIKARWVERLRSGRYAQTKSSLTNDSQDAFCCLGVLCTIAEDDGIVKRADWEHGSTLPEAVQTWAGIGEADPVIDGRHTRASAANDHGAKFPDIATAIQGSM